MSFAEAAWYGSRKVNGINKPGPGDEWLANGLLFLWSTIEYNFAHSLARTKCLHHALKLPGMMVVAFD